MAGKNQTKAWNAKVAKKNRKDRKEKPQRSQRKTAMFAKRNSLRKDG
jgi:hypothetical protein